MPWKYTIDRNSIILLLSLFPKILHPPLLRARYATVNCVRCRCSSISFYSIIAHHWPFDKSKKQQVYHEGTVLYVQRKSNEAIFTKCCEPRCDHCSNHSVINQIAWEYLRERDFKWPNPNPIYRSSKSLYDLYRDKLFTIMDIIFWDFLILNQIFFSAQMKRSVIIWINMVYTSFLTSCWMTKT